MHKKNVPKGPWDFRLLDGTARGLEYLMQSPGKVILACQGGVMCLISRLMMGKDPARKNRRTPASS